ncbi:MAG: hypothetical protein ACKVU4_11535 [Phycisphaerales bacterium]
MSGQNRTDGSRGFALVELAAIVAVAAVLMALIAVTGVESRRQARLGDDIANLRRIAEWTGAYANDNTDLFWSFSWKKGYNQSQWPDLNAAAQTNDLGAAAAQAIDILRRRAGRTDIQVITAWIPHVLFGHLALLDYTGGPMPELTMISSMDKFRLSWARDPSGYDQGLYTPNPGLGNTGKRWPYSASFQMSTAFFDSTALASDRITQNTNQSIFLVPGNALLGARSHADAAFPAHKVLLHDSNARHFGTRMPYCTQDQARLPLLFVDGSVSVRGASESNPGWVPNSPSNGLASQFQYQPNAWDPPTTTGAPSELVNGRFRWTRGTTTMHGVAGRDFGGRETCSGQPQCP